MKQTGRMLRACVGIGWSLALAGAGCRQEMYNQPRHEPLEFNPFFADGMSARPLVEGTVARGYLRADEALYTGLVGTNFAAEFPFPVTREVLERGRERYDIYCAVCHGRTGAGNGPIVQRGFPPPPPYSLERLREAPPGYFFYVITHGYGVMYPYATRVEPEDRWAIVGYIRALQLSQHAPVTTLPSEVRARLEATP